MDSNNYGLPAAPEQVSRRGFIVTTLASGFAVASGALHAEAIQTSADGLTAGEVSIPVKDGKVPAYRAFPAKAGKFPVVIVVSEIFGVHEHIKDMCRRFAKLGYFAIAPELFARQGDVSKMKEIDDIMSKVIAKVPDAQVFSDLDATVAFAQASGHANASRLGVVGYCWGGRTVWMYCARNAKVTAGVAYYGLLAGMKSPPLRAQDPTDVAGSLAVPVLGMYAGLDTFIKEDQIEQMRAALAKGQSGSELIIFPGVNHGFNADYRPSYDRTAATYAWELTRNWLKNHGV